MPVTIFSTCSTWNGWTWTCHVAKSSSAMGELNVAVFMDSGAMDVGVQVWIRIGTDVWWLYCMLEVNEAGNTDEELELAIWPLMKVATDLFMGEASPLISEVVVDMLRVLCGIHF